MNEFSLRDYSHGDDVSIYIYINIYIYIKGGGIRVYLKVRSSDGGVDREVVSICKHSNKHTDFKFKIRV